VGYLLVGLQVGEELRHHVHSSQCSLAENRYSPASPSPTKLT
jgi:hypothetical protein